jgi:hypothetical protein
VGGAAGFGGCFWPQSTVQPRIRGTVSRCRADNGRQRCGWGGGHPWADRFVTVSCSWWLAPLTLAAVIGPSRPSGPRFGAQRAVTGQPTGLQRCGWGGRHLIFVGWARGWAGRFAINCGGAHRGDFYRYLLTCSAAYTGGPFSDEGRLHLDAHRGFILRWCGVTTNFPVRLRVRVASLLLSKWLNRLQR